MAYKKIRILLYQEAGWCIAQCLEYDIRAQAKTIPQVLDYIGMAMEETRLDSLKRHGKPFAHIGPAPEIFEQMWKNRKARLQPLSKSKKQLTIQQHRPPALAIA